MTRRSPPPDPLLRRPPFDPAAIETALALEARALSIHRQTDDVTDVPRRAELRRQACDLDAPGRRARSGGVPAGKDDDTMNTVLAHGSMVFPDFSDEVREVLLYPNDTRHEEWLWATRWPSHMERALEAIAEHENGPRPRRAWIKLLKKQMIEDGVDIEARRRWF